VAVLTVFAVPRKRGPRKRPQTVKTIEALMTNNGRGASPRRRTFK